jgi:cellulose synthase/poly-beta-1,6-N-acetylglucosamine synthase-like glycosyltransferase
MKRWKSDVGLEARMFITMFLLGVLYLAFSVISLYMVFLFILLYFENRRRLGGVPPKAKSTPSVSIIVPAYNEEGKIAGTIKSLKALHYPKGRLEIIVVDDCSTTGRASTSGSCRPQRISESSSTNTTWERELRCVPASRRYVRCRSRAGRRSGI